MGRGANWISQENLALAKSWLAILEDASTGMNQDASMFWKQVIAEFLQIALPQVSGEPKTEQSIQTRWSLVAGNIQNFGGCLESVHRNLGSGQHKEDKLKQAYQTFVVDWPKRGPFEQIDAYRILENAPKFKARYKWVYRHSQNGDTSSPESALVDVFTAALDKQTKAREGHQRQQDKGQEMLELTCSTLMMSILEEQIPPSSCEFFHVARTIFFQNLASAQSPAAHTSSEQQTGPTHPNPPPPLPAYPDLPTNHSMGNDVPFAPPESDVDVAQENLNFGLNIGSFQL